LSFFAALGIFLGKQRTVPLRSYVLEIKNQGDVGGSPRRELLPSGTTMVACQQPNP
jgi:hypothetical protein